MDGRDAKLEGLREAARVGIAAFERGEFKEFADAEALVAYLNRVVDAVLAEDAGEA